MFHLNLLYIYFKLQFPNHFDTKFLFWLPHSLLFAEKFIVVPLFKLESDELSLMLRFFHYYFFSSEKASFPVPVVTCTLYVPFVEALNSFLLKLLIALPFIYHTYLYPLIVVYGLTVAGSFAKLYFDEIWNSLIQ
jgi:hypothetical protein